MVYNSKTVFDIPLLLKLKHMLLHYINEIASVTSCGNKARNDGSVDIQFFIVTYSQVIHKLRKLASRTETQLERTSEMSRGNAVSSSYNANCQLQINNKDKF